MALKAPIFSFETPRDQCTHCTARVYYEGLCIGFETSTAKHTTGHNLTSTTVPEVIPQGRYSKRTRKHSNKAENICEQVNNDVHVITYISRTFS